jgi:hypothetical protein
MPRALSVGAALNADLAADKAAPTERGYGADQL